MNKDILIAGYGGQGVLTLAQIISLAGLEAGLNVKQSELHGLAQRGGSLQAHVRLSDKEVFSPMIAKGSADLIISMDLLEGWRAQEYGSKDSTVTLVNRNLFWPYEDKIDSEESEKNIKKHSKQVIFSPAEKTVKELIGSNMSVNVFLFAQAVSHKLLPFSSDVAWSAIEQKLKGKALENNKKVFEKGLA